MQSDLIFNLANSTWFLEHKNHDVLIDKTWINKNLNPTDDALNEPLNKKFIATIKRLREIIIDAFNGESIENSIDFLNEILQKSSFYDQISISSTELSLIQVSLSSIENRIVAHIVIELVNLVKSNSVDKIRRCQNDDCKFYYQDMSKNQSKKYCSTKCNNVAKVRRYRSRQK